MFGDELLIAGSKLLLLELHAAPPPPPPMTTPFMVALGLGSPMRCGLLLLPVALSVIKELAEPKVWWCGACPSMLVLVVLLLLLCGNNGEAEAGDEKGSPRPVRSSGLPLF